MAAAIGDSELFLDARTAQTKDFRYQRGNTEGAECTSRSMRAVRQALTFPTLSPFRLLRQWFAQCCNFAVIELAFAQKQQPALD